MNKRSNREGLRGKLHIPSVNLRLIQLVFSCPFYRSSILTSRSSIGESGAGWVKGQVESPFLKTSFDIVSLFSFRKIVSSDAIYLWRHFVCDQQVYTWVNSPPYSPFAPYGKFWTTSSFSVSAQWIWDRNIIFADMNSRKTLDSRDTTS